MRISFVVCAALLAVTACGSEGDSTATPQAAVGTDAPSTTSTTAEPQQLTVELTLYNRTDLVRARSGIAHDKATRECGLRNSSRTGLDTSGKLTVKSRTGTVIGVADVPTGTLSGIEYAEDQKTVIWSDCLVVVTVPLFEPVSDLALFEFRWPDSAMSFDDSAVPTDSKVTFQYTVPS
jgi:hypothetical protein